MHRNIFHRASPLLFWRTSSIEDTCGEGQGGRECRDRPQRLRWRRQRREVGSGRERTRNLRRTGVGPLSRNRIFVWRRDDVRIGDDKQRLQSIHCNKASMLMYHSNRILEHNKPPWLLSSWTNSSLNPAPSGTTMSTAASSELLICLKNKVLLSKLRQSHDDLHHLLLHPGLFEQR